MQVFFESRDPKGTHMRDHALGRLHFALRRLKAYVLWVKVQLTDVNGPRGGSDKRCQIELKTQGAGTLIIHSTGSDWRAVLERSLSRVMKVLARKLAKAKAPPHMRAKKLGFIASGTQDSLPH